MLEAIAIIIIATLGILTIIFGFECAILIGTYSDRKNYQDWAYRTINRQEALLEKLGL